MTFWGLVQIFVDLVLLTSAGFMWVKLHRPQKDDPRMSRGLQLLQSKISVLEDLSDRTETQVTQLTALMEQKCRDIQSTIYQAEKQVQLIEASMGKSLEVAKIFQDKIPHQEIIERQNSLKYIKAARMAHQGSSIEEISAQVDLSRGEIEFIAKVNRDQLQFSEEDLPAWAKEEASNQESQQSRNIVEPIFQKPTQAAVPEDALSQLGAQFRQAFQPNMPQGFISPEAPQALGSSSPQALGSSSPQALGSFSPQALGSFSPQSHRSPSPHAAASPLRFQAQQEPQTQASQSSSQPPTPKLKSSVTISPREDGIVRKVVFPKIDVHNNLG